MYALAESRLVRLPDDPALAPPQARIRTLRDRKPGARRAQILHRPRAIEYGPDRSGVATTDIGSAVLAATNEQIRALMDAAPKTCPANVYRRLVAVAKIIRYAPTRDARLSLLALVAWGSPLLEQLEARHDAEASSARGILEAACEEDGSPVIHPLSTHDCFGRGPLVIFPTGREHTLESGITRTRQARWTRLPYSEVDMTKNNTRSSSTSKADVGKASTLPTSKPLSGTSREDMRRDTYTPAHRQAVIGSLSNSAG